MKPDCLWIYTSYLIMGFSKAFPAPQLLIWHEACKKVTLESLKKGKILITYAISSVDKTVMSFLENCLWKPFFLFLWKQKSLGEYFQDKRS